MKNVLFSHLDLDGASGGSLDEHEIKVGATKLSDFKKFIHVFSGHYHKRQTIGNFTYVGNPLHKDFGDSGQDKGVHLLEFINGKLEVEFIPLGEEFPQFVKFRVLELSDWEKVEDHRERRPQDYIHIDYAPGLSPPPSLNMDVPIPDIKQMTTKFELPMLRVKGNGESMDPVDLYLEYQGGLGVKVPDKANTFLQGILERARNV